MSGDDTSDYWFATSSPRPEATAMLFCFPHAGGSPAAFTNWQSVLGLDIEVNAVALPGRGRRIAEDPAIEPAQIAAAIARRANRSYALFGHSLGALVAFEVIRHLRRMNVALPVRLFASGCTAPDHPRGTGILDGLSRLSDLAFLERLAVAGGMRTEVLAHQDLLELLLPILRADFGWLDDYVYCSESPLEIPITTLIVLIRNSST